MSRGVAAGNALRVGRKRRNVPVPPLGEIAPLHPLALIGELRIGATVALEQRHPFRAELFPAGTEVFREMLVDASRNQEFFVLRPTVGALRELHLFVAQRFAMRTGGVLFVRGAIPDMALD